jgi:hypothetical protein
MIAFTSMNKIRVCIFAGLALLVTLPITSFAASSSSSDTSSAVGLGVRYMRELPSFATYPFGTGDLGYGLSYEIRDTAGYWQLAACYSPRPSGTNSTSIDYVLTPEVNLVIQDTDPKWKYLRGGIGILNSYMPSKDKTKDDWLGFYYHFMLGLNFDLGKIGLEINSYYTFDDFSKLSEFKFGDLEYGCWINYVF